MKRIDNKFLRKIIGGSNDGFWTGVGYHSGTFLNCKKNHFLKDLVIPGYCLYKSFN